jgi:hypothetical protein
VRELGQRLAPVRDSTVRVSALKRLRSTYERNSRRKGPIPSGRGLPPAIAPPSGGYGPDT